MAPIYLLLAASLLLAQDWTPRLGRPSEAGRWLCWSYIGKTSRAVTISESHPLNWYASHLSELDPETKSRVDSDGRWANLRATPTTAGYLSGREVIDLTFRFPGEDRPAAKLILLANPGGYRPIVWILPDTQVDFVKSQVLTISNTPVLICLNRIPGPGNFAFEDYFVLDPASDLPLNLAIDASIRRELKRILPPGVGVLKGGGFDIKSLHYSQDVWRRADPDCCPTAGKVEIQFRLDGLRANPVTASYSR